MPLSKSANRCARDRCNSTRAARAVATAAARCSVALAQARAACVTPAPVPANPCARITRRAAGRVTLTRRDTRANPDKGETAPNWTLAAPLGTTTRRAVGAPTCNLPHPLRLPVALGVLPLPATARRRAAKSRLSRALTRAPIESDRRCQTLPDRKDSRHARPDAKPAPCAAVAMSRHEPGARW